MQSMEGCTFRPFPRLLKELREAIWRECLPDRVCEIDRAASELIYYDNEPEAPCRLSHTSILNEVPPTITRICQESRAVAFRAGKEAARANEIHNSTYNNDTKYSWAVSTMRTSMMNEWRDRVPSMVHMYWTPVYRADYDYGLNSSRTEPDSILWLAANAARWAKGRASIMVDRLCDFTWEGHWNPYWDESDDEDYETPRDFEAPPQARKPSVVEQRWISAFKNLETCLVVLQIVVIHTDLKTGAETGLFGVLGDAPNQIIPMAEEDKVARYYDLARKCEDREQVSNRQYLEIRSYQVAKRRLSDRIVYDYGTEELVPIMRPAIMFRLCDRMCNHPDLTRNPPSPICDLSRNRVRRERRSPSTSKNSLKASPTTSRLMDHHVCVIFTAKRGCSGSTSSCSAAAN